jgi:ABC-type lipoprotein release transport system permease subunit
MLWFKMGWRNLWRNRRRTIIELIAIAGSVFVGVSWNNLAVGSYDQMINDGVKMGSGHIGIYHKGYMDTHKTEQVVSIDRMITELEREPYVEGVYPRLKVPGLIRSSHESRPTVLLGFDIDREYGLNPLLESKRLVRGSVPGDSVKNGVLIGVRLARELEVDIGNKCVIMLQDTQGEIISRLVRVTGILQTNAREIDGALVILPRKRLAEFIGDPNAAHEVAVMLHHHDIIRKAFPRIKNIADNYPNARAYRWEDAMPELAAGVKVDHVSLIIMVAILYIVVGIGTINTLLMSVMERIREFGVIRAIGTSRSFIRRILFAEAFVLSLFGVTIGLVFSFILTLYTSTVGIDFSSLMEEQGMGGVLMDPIIYPTWDVPGILTMSIGMIVLALIASLYPTKYVLNIKPSEAMRIY